MVEKSNALDVQDPFKDRNDNEKKQKCTISLMWSTMHFRITSFSANYSYGAQDFTRVPGEEGLNINQGLDLYRYRHSYLLFILKIFRPRLCSQWWGGTMENLPLQLKETPIQMVFLLPHFSANLKASSSLLATNRSPKAPPPPISDVSPG